jgi:hypothetical protein
MMLGIASRELWEVALDARVIADGEGTRLPARNRRSQRLLLGLHAVPDPAHAGGTFSRQPALHPRHPEQA